MNKQDFIIGIDMDDTIENLGEAWVNALNIKYGYNYTVNDITDWDMTKTYTNLSKSEIFSILLEDDFWKTVTPKYSAVYYIERLINDGFTVFICTNTDYRTLKSKMDNVLFKYFPFLTWKNVIVCKQKRLCNFDVLVDDYYQNLIGGKYIGILYKTPHIMINPKDYPNMYCKDNWKDIYSLINYLYRKKESESNYVIDTNK